MYTVVLATIFISGLLAEEIPLIQYFTPQDAQSNFHGLAKELPHLRNSKNERMGTSIYDYSFLSDPGVKPVMEQNTESPPSKEIFGSLFMPQVNESLLKMPFLGFSQNIANHNVAGSLMQQPTSANNGIELFMGQTQNLFNPNLFAQNQQTTNNMQQLSQQKQQPESNIQNQLNANQLNQILTMLSNQNLQTATPNFSNTLYSMLMAAQNNKNRQQSPPIGNVNYGQTVGLNGQSGDFTFGHTLSAPKILDLTSIFSQNIEKTKSNENKKVHLDVTDLLAKIATQSEKAPSDIQTHYKFALDEEKPIVIKLDKPNIKVSESPKFEFDDYVKHFEKSKIANSESFESKFSEFLSRPTLHKTSSYESALHDFSKIPSESYETKFHDYLNRPSLHIEDSKVHKDISEYRFPLESKKPKIVHHHHTIESKLPKTEFNFDEYKFSPKFMHKGYKFPAQFSGETKFGNEAPKFHNFNGIRFDEPPAFGGKFEKEFKSNKMGNRQKQKPKSRPQPPKFKPRINPPPKKISPPAKYLIKITKH